MLFRSEGACLPSRFAEFFVAAGEGASFAAEALLAKAAKEIKTRSLANMIIPSSKRHNGMQKKSMPGSGWRSDAKAGMDFPLMIESIVNIMGVFCRENARQFHPAPSGNGL